MNRFSRTLCLALPGLFLAASLFAAGKGEAEAGVKLGFLVKQAEEPWFQNEWKYAQQAADKYGFELIKIGIPDGDKTIAAIDNLGAQKADGFVICVPDTKLGPAVVQKAKQYNLKVYAVDDRFVGADGKPMTQVPYMGISATEIGIGVGKALVDEMKARDWDPRETALMVASWDQLETIKQRTDNAKAVVEEAFPELRVVNAPLKTLDQPGSFDAANIALTQNPDIKHWLICGGNDESVVGPVRAMENRGVSADNMIAIGIGASLANEFLKEEITGYFGTSVLSPYRHGFETATLMYLWITEGTQPPLDTRTAGYIVTRKDDWKKRFAELGVELQQ